MFYEISRLSVSLLRVSSRRISHTTRRPYFEEEDGIDYHFVSEEDFQSMIQMVRELLVKLLRTAQTPGENL